MFQSNKQKRPESNNPKPGSGLTEADQAVLNVIRSKGENVINKRNIQTETKLPTIVITKCIKNLTALSLINEIPHAQFKRNHYIATEFMPSNTVTSGQWYLNGELDTEFINKLKHVCLQIVKKLKVATAEGVYEFIMKNRLIYIECTSKQIGEMLGSMVLENLIIAVKSSGHGEYHSILVGNVCYRCAADNRNQGLKTSAMASVPCGVCPVIGDCTPDGLISPSTCVYYTKWLDF